MNGDNFYNAIRKSQRVFPIKWIVRKYPSRVEEIGLVQVREVFVSTPHNRVYRRTMRL